MIEDDDSIETQKVHEIFDGVENETEIRETYFQLSPLVVIRKFPPKTLKFKGILVVCVLLS